MVILLLLWSLQLRTCLAKLPSLRTSFPHKQTLFDEDYCITLYRGVAMDSSGSHFGKNEEMDPYVDSNRWFHFLEFFFFVPSETWRLPSWFFGLSKTWGDNEFHCCGIRSPEFVTHMGNRRSHVFFAIFQLKISVSKAGAMIWGFKKKVEFLVCTSKENSPNHANTLRSSYSFEV